MKSKEKEQQRKERTVIRIYGHVYGRTRKYNDTQIQWKTKGMNNTKAEKMKERKRNEMEKRSYGNLMEMKCNRKEQ